MYFIYCLLSLKDKKTYLGQSNNLKNRIRKHNSGQVKATKYRRPLKLLFFEQFKTRKEAMAREKWWKSGAGRRNLKKYFKDNKFDKNY